MPIPPELPGALPHDPTPTYAMLYLVVNTLTLLGVMPPPPPPKKKEVFAH